VEGMCVAHRVRRLGVGWVAVLLGILATAVSAAGSGIPSLWGDEAASVMSAVRPVATLWPVLERVDAVHGVYYLLLHQWVEFFGVSAFSVRFPSALAIGFATAGLVLLANRLGGFRLAVIAGFVFMILPRTTYMGAEARSYALSAAFAVWLTLLLVVMIRRGLVTLGEHPLHQSRRRITTIAGWVLYAATLAVGISIFLYLAFLALAHLAIVLMLRSTRRTMLAWAFATAAAAGVILTFVLEVIAQRQQVAFLANRPRVDAPQILIDQWMGNLGFAIVAWGIIVFGLVWAVKMARTPGQRFAPVTMVGLAWLVIPQVLMLALTAVTPLYALRYLSFVTPSLALLLAFPLAALTRIPRRAWIAAVLVLALIASAALTYVGQRQPFAKDNGTDFSEISATIGQVSAPGDAVIFDPTIRPSRRPRLAIHLYPEGFTKVTDVLLSRSFDSRSGLWDTQHSITDSAEYFAGIDRVWVVEANFGSVWALAELEAQGFVVVQVIPENVSIIYQLERRPA
jgi:mannosyltransferase